MTEHPEIGPATAGTFPVQEVIDAIEECPTPCDDDCETDCHEGHQPRWKRDHQPWDCPSRRHWTQEQIDAAWRRGRDRMRELGFAPEGQERAEPS